MSSVSGSAPRADFAMRGLAISFLIPPRMASAASLFKVLLRMIDHCMLLIRGMVNWAHAPMFLGTQTHELEGYVSGQARDDCEHTRILSAGD